jgi:hypothetical protein
MSKTTATHRTAKRYSRRERIGLFDIQNNLSFKPQRGEINIVSNAPGVADSYHTRPPRRKLSQLFKPQRGEINIVSNAPGVADSYHTRPPRRKLSQLCGGS